MAEQSPDALCSTDPSCPPSKQPPATADDWVLASEPGEIDGVRFGQLQLYHDQRGWLAEMFRCDEMVPELQPVMAYISQSEPGLLRRENAVGRKRHEHRTHKIGFSGKWTR